MEEEEGNKGEETKRMAAHARSRRNQLALVLIERTESGHERHATLPFKPHEHTKLPSPGVRWSRTYDLGRTPW